MNLTAKYVIIQAQGLQVPVLLPELGGIAHAEVQRLGHPVSAGLCELQGDEWHAHGCSHSLGLKSRGAVDAEILGRYFTRPPATNGGQP